MELTLTRQSAQKADRQLNELDERIWLEEADEHSVGNAVAVAYDMFRI